MATEYKKTFEQYLEVIHSYAFPSWETFDQIMTRWARGCGMEPDDFKSIKHIQGCLFVEYFTDEKHHQKYYITASKRDEKWKDQKEGDVHVYRTHYIGISKYGNPEIMTEMTYLKTLDQNEYQRIMKNPSKVRYEIVEKN
jgi:hypothetical protein